MKLTHDLQLDIAATVGRILKEGPTFDPDDAERLLALLSDEVGAKPTNNEIEIEFPWPAFVTRARREFGSGGRHAFAGGPAPRDDTLETARWKMGDGDVVYAGIWSLVWGRGLDWPWLRRRIVTVEIAKRIKTRAEDGDGHWLEFDAASRAALRLRSTRWKTVTLALPGRRIAFSIATHPTSKIPGPKQQPGS